MTEPASRGRLVMLVYNNIAFDSRVQKQARSAAERGWDVTLIGKRAKSDTVLEWKIGKAEARLIHVPSQMFHRRSEHRRALLRSPLAYPNSRIAGYRMRESAARVWNVRFELAKNEIGGSSALRRLWLNVRMTAARAIRAWTRLRNTKTRKLARIRRTMTSPVDRMSTAWWKSTRGSMAWSQLDPAIWDWELAYGAELDRLRPDLIHANDHRMLMTAARAKVRAKAEGHDIKLVWDSHEYLPGISTAKLHPRWLPAQMLMEREYASDADAVVTVSDTLADMLVSEHHLAERPSVVLNAPSVGRESDDRGTPDIRTLCGLAADVPLIAYSGGSAPQRGIGTMVEALPLLPATHMAIVVADATVADVTTLVRRAEELGAADRLHVLPYVRVDEIARFLSTADIGAIPIHHWLNHEIALITKFFEYSHARLPILVSDVKAMSAMVRQTGQGEVFIAEDVASYVEGVKKILSNKSRYVAAYDAPGLLDNWTWEKQADVLDDVYASVLTTTPQKQG